MYVTHVAVIHLKVDDMVLFLDQYKASIVQCVSVSTVACCSVLWLCSKTLDLK